MQTLSDVSEDLAREAEMPLNGLLGCSRDREAGGKVKRKPGIRGADLNRETKMSVTLQKSTPPEESLFPGPQPPRSLAGQGNHPQAFILA